MEMIGAFYLKTCLIIVFIPRLCFSSLHSTFSHYEILTPHHIAVIVKRDAGGRERQKELTLSIFGRRVVLFLKSGLPKSLVSPDASLHAIHANGTKSRINLDFNDFHHGIIKDYDTSRVHSFYHDGLWTIQAVHPSMSFSVEPLSLHTRLGWTNQMVAYRHRDIRFGNDTGKPFCGHDSIPRKYSASPPGYGILKTENMNNIPDIYPRKTIDKKPTKRARKTRSSPNRVNESRNRRYVDSNLVCDVLAIADYSFYQGIGDKSLIKTSKLLITAYAVVNDVFTSTKFNSAKSVGIQIRAMEIYTHSGDLLPEMDSSVETDGIDVLMLLKKKPYYKDHCLVHASMEYLFQKQTLGLALTPSESVFGICGTKHFDDSLNIGISTVVHKDYIVSFTTYTLVLTHEFGHGFGASHDNPKTHPEECYPGEKHGGKYLMWYRSTNGLNPNNRQFSSCSIKGIDKVLKTRPSCLVPKDLIDHNTCGNGILDYGEDCDIGNLVTPDHADKCCAANCRFNPQAICSSFNHPCCKDCTVAPTSQACVNKIEHFCFEKSFCDGLDFNTCPIPRSKPNGHKCGDHGECQNGNCISFCALLGLMKSPKERYGRCGCDKDRASMCSICCKKLDFNDTKKSPCFETDKYFSDGSPCILGYCKNGYCEDSGDMDESGWGLTAEGKQSVKGSTGYFPLTIGAFTVASIIGFVIATLYFKRRASRLGAEEH